MIKKKNNLFLLKIFSFLYILSLNFHQISIFQLDNKIFFKLADVFFIILFISFLYNLKNLSNIKIDKFDILVSVFSLISIIQFLFFKNSISIVGLIASIYLFSIYFIYKILLLNNFLGIIKNYIIISGLAASVLGILGWIMIQFNINSPFILVYDYPFKIGNAGRATALFETPNSLFLFLILPLFFSLNKLRENYKIKNFIVFIIILFCAILTFSKSLILIFGLLIIYFFYFKNKKIKNYSIILYIIISTFYLFITNILIINKSSNFYNILLSKTYTGGLNDIVYENKDYIFIKTNYFLAKKKNWELTKESPIIGSGFNSFTNYKNLDYPGLVGRPHSTYFGFLSEYGLIGLFFIILLFFNLFDNRLNRSFFGLCLNLIVLFLIIDAFNTDLIFTKIFWIFFSIMNYTKIEFSQKKI